VLIASVSIEAANSWPSGANYRNNLYDILLCRWV